MTEEKMTASFLVESKEFRHHSYWGSKIVFRLNHFILLNLPYENVLLLENCSIMKSSILFPTQRHRFNFFCWYRRTLITLIFTWCLTWHRSRNLQHKGRPWCPGQRKETKGKVGKETGMPITNTSQKLLLKFWIGSHPELQDEQLCKSFK